MDDRTTRDDACVPPRDSFRFQRRPTARRPGVEPLEGRALMAASPRLGANTLPNPVATLTANEVDILLQRAARATASDDGIIAIVDRGGNILGVRMEQGVSPSITATTETLVFAVDGAVAEARTGAFFGNNQAPLTSRTIQFISQSTMTQREVESNPNIADYNSTARGPGFVAPIGAKAHFPPGVQFTPQVDLFQIEHTNRDSIVSPGPDHVRGTPDDVLLPSRFNVPTQFITLDDSGQPKTINAPESYGFVSGILPAAQSRGIGTLPGGIPIYKDGQVVGGIGVFFPGETGFATESNSILNERPFYDPSKPDRSVEAEYIAFVAVGGSKIGQASFNTPQMNKTLGLPALPSGKKFLQGFDLPSGRIDLVGITLDIFGSHGRQGLKNLIDTGAKLGLGDVFSGQNLAISPGKSNLNAKVSSETDANLAAGQAVPQGWLVNPHDAQDGSGLTADDVTKIINRGIREAQIVRAAIRLPLDSFARMMISVVDKSGNILGLFRMPDTTFFSIDVAVAKGRNVTYYADPAQLQPEDRLSNIEPGTALTNRTFRYVTEPRFPEGIDGNPPGPFSILNEQTLRNGSPDLLKPASAFQTVQGFDSFNAQTNFRQPFNLNQNGIVFFPGSVPLYKEVNGQKVLVGGLGVSGDGVDQDDDVTFVASTGFSTGGTDVKRSDQVRLRGARLPYQKFNRQPHNTRFQPKQIFPDNLPGNVKPILPTRFPKGSKAR